MTLADTIRDFITTKLNWNGKRELLTEDYPLIENHVLDSLGLFMMISFVEEQMGVHIADEELLPENFGTIGAITSLIERKRAATT